MELISETTTTEYKGKCAVIYKDRELDIEEYTANGEAEVTYMFHRYSNTVTHSHLDPEYGCSSPFTAAYFEYIATHNSIPTFAVSPESKHGLVFIMLDEEGNEKPMRFIAEVIRHNDTYCLNLEEFGVYVFTKEAMKSDPYLMEMYIVLEIHRTLDKKHLLIIDHDQDEFGAVDTHYKQILIGRTNKNGTLDSYIQDGEKYNFVYNDKGELIDVQTFSGDKIAYISVTPDRANITHRIPYTKTSYGVLISDPDHILYKTYYRETDEDEQDIETTIRLLNKEESNNFLENNEKI